MTEITANYDETWKEAITEYFEDFLTFFYPHLYQQDESKTWRPNSYGYGIGESQVKIDFSILKLLDYQWEELEESNNLFATVVMAHLRTKATTSNLTQREQWKWNLVRGLYERGLTKFDIINLGKFIDKMMTLPPKLQLDFNDKLNQYEKERNMPFLSTIEEMALEKDQQKGAKETRKQDILKILQNRFDGLPDEMVTTINEIDDMSVLENLLLPSISVNCLAEFQQLLNDSLTIENQS
ncbi:hypothetical protein WJM97_05555 [Okeanomitos corallinicola TIOX110]|uniref:Transposase n=1 Tax=Okeanomitos corallinicola TIOX110 TaxID=3133117 RepID=A0ABZ2UXW2_9CYAN